MKNLILLIFLFLTFSCVTKSKLSMVPTGETIYIDESLGIVHVMFPCKDKPRKKEVCGMSVQMDAELYGETYVGEKREIK